ncbi:uncharacterized protein FIBRA_06058 [Fibroporia radiculosa]|uniref:Uncharacterized protein n=1 Tax=Fibroporia radiculosa TaxID=599839 RepID=J4HYJ0_9APHY|nr:uncharacterized protein FIBRA_06058 [Fibroporia radiculosa]CCM03907.1 predicted protein [Fibroporia radiculosa]
MPAWIAERQSDYYDLGEGAMADVEAQVVLGPVAVGSSGWTMMAMQSLGGNSYFLDTLAIPSYVACASVLALLSQFALQKVRTKRNAEKHNRGTETGDEGVAAEVAETTVADAQPVDATIRIFNFVRLTACLSLLGMTIFTAYLAAWGDATDVQPTAISNSVWLQIALCATYIYSSLLALHSVLAPPSTTGTTTRHLTLILVSTWLVYIYRDVWPLATVLLTPLDAAEGMLLWAKFSMLTLTAVLIPLFVPRRYVPLDPNNPSLTPAPEQTASIASLSMYFFLDKTVLEAYQVEHLPLERLPPLGDYDGASNLMKRSFPELDPFQSSKKGRHILWGFLRVFRLDVIMMCIMLTLLTLARFASPLGIRNLLWYLESDGADVFVRPWLWIAWLFFGPVLGTVFDSWFAYIWTRTLVRMEAILTQLVFDHALRMRVKADAASDSETKEKEQPQVGVSPDAASGSGSGSSEQDDAASTTTLTADIDAGSTQGKQKAKAPSEDGNAASAQGPPAKGKKDDKSDEGKEEDMGKNAVGKVNNLITTDVGALMMGQGVFYFAVQIPLQIVLCVWFLYDILGVSAFAGLVVIIATLPLPGVVANKSGSVQEEKMKKTDARVQSVTDSLGVIRMVKLFGWESRLTQQLTEKRETELKWIMRTKLWDILIQSMNHVIPLMTMLITFVTYVSDSSTSFAQPAFETETFPAASTVFSSMAVFEMFSMQLGLIFGFLPGIVRVRVALDRINEFMHKTELLDNFGEEPAMRTELTLLVPNMHADAIGFRNASFTWTNDQIDSNPSTPGALRRNFILRIEDELHFQRGSINLIVGPTGSGKTSLLMALLGEMHYIPAGPDSFYNLPRSGGIAYAAQESWVQNETIRDNILFGTPYDEERYHKVITQCGLQRDLDLFDAGDQTEVGEKGITLSGGQKARVTLARAVYSTAEILLLDDVLAALDVHTARWIVEKCFKGDLIQGRTVLLVTHNVTITNPISQFVVSLAGGRISSQGSLLSALEHDQKLAAEVAEERQALEKAEMDIQEEKQEEEAKKIVGKLVVAEEIAVGHVGWPAMRFYLASWGGKHRILFWTGCLSLLVVTELAYNAQIWYLGYWAKQYEINDASRVNTLSYIGVYAIVILISALTDVVFALVNAVGIQRASRKIHKDLITSVLGTTLRWLDKTPASRIITRCTQDMDSIDTTVGQFTGILMNMTMCMLVKLVAVVAMSPIFVFPGTFLAAAGTWMGQVYMKAQLSVKREISNARAPVLGLFGAAFTGLISIRAYGAQDLFRKESFKRIDKYTRASRTFNNLNRWISVRIDVLGAMFSTSLAAYLVYGGSSASDTGFTLNMAVGFSNLILHVVRMYNMLEVAGNSLERVKQYLEIEQEPKPTEHGVPPAYWPASGGLRVQSLSARYSPDGPRVLEDISFEIKSGERVGIVGRTGSGKSSLTLALLRCILTEGKVYYDGIPTDSINLDALRSHVTIIPQVPELLSGTLRQNLDPFERYDDVILNDALRSAGLFALQTDIDENIITLDTHISSGGSNLSVGQRQILALARAIVRQSKLLILDEATSAIDYATDTVIQESLRKELDKGVTVLTIAHRLQTIMDADKIMVLDAGRIVEFGKPDILLKDEKSLLRALVDESGDREKLYAIAGSCRTLI